MFWSKLDNKVMYETDSEMTDMIEGKMATNSEQMTKYLLNMGMAWLGSIDTRMIPIPQCDWRWEYSWTTQRSKKNLVISRTQRQIDYPSIEMHMQMIFMFKSNYVLA